MSYIIIKSSRAYSGGPGYAGSKTCEKAGVEPGKIYANRAEAEHDAALLSEVNPVGFVVEEYFDPPSKHMPWRYEIYFNASGPIGIVVENKGRRAHYNYSGKNHALLNVLLFHYRYTCGWWQHENETVWWFDFRVQ